MKKLILTELILLFLATTFVTDSPPPGWYQQTLPVNKIIDDLFFVDSLKGWVVTTGGSNATDTAFILNTTDGGINWIIQKTGIEKLDAVQFVNDNTGYACGKLYSGIQLSIYKTTNSGINWNALNNISGIGPTDLFFVNESTGWISDVSGAGGLYKTTNGGVNWTQQLGASFTPSRLFFLNNDTGWAVCNTTRLYRTTNSGGNWGQIYNFVGSLVDVFFVSKDTGWVTGGGGNGIMRTINGGFNWDTVNTPQVLGTPELSFVNNKRGWSGCAFNKVISTRDGYNWEYQTTPAFTDYSIQFVDSLKGWAGTNILIHTTDGGGPSIIQQISNEVPVNFKLYQNYPNPFNPNTKIKASLSPSEGGKQNVKLIVYDITGKEISVLLNGQFSPGTYEVDFSGEGLSSGVYFYKITITAGKEVFSDTKRMLMIK